MSRVHPGTRGLVVLAMWALSAAIGLSVTMARPAEAAQPLVRPVPLTMEAASKVDPTLRFLLSMPNKSLRTLAPIAMQIEVGGTSPSDLVLPVLVRTSLDDAELAALGVTPDSRAGEIVTAVVSPEQLSRLAGDPRVTVIEASRRLTTTLDASIPEIRADLVNNVGAPPAGYTGSGVIVGMIDSGIDHTHDDFKKADGTSRILGIWDMSLDGHPPTGFNYGYEYTKAMIDGNQAGNHVDTGAHGSHVMGIAAGDGSSVTGHPYRGVAWEADIMAVRNAYCDLFCYGGGAPPWEYGGLYGQPQGTKGCVDGLNYMLNKAASLGKKLSVNQSQGVIKGPHDGTTVFEQAYNNLVNQNGLIISISAGNDQDSNWHGRTQVSAGGTGTFTLEKGYVQDPQDVNRYYMDFECWYPAGKSFRWQIVSPGGTTIDIPSSVPADQYPGFITSQPDTVWAWTATSHPVNGQGFANFIVWDMVQGVESGTWTVRAISENNSAGTVDLYCERNQYYLAVTGSTVSLESIMGMPGSCDGAITVASYNTKLTWNGADGQTHTTTGWGDLNDLSTFSSHGPRRDGVQKPDIAAPGCQLMSVYAAGSQTDASNIEPHLRHRIMAGTSMASPHVAGAVALMLQKDPTLTPAQVKQTLRETARQDAYTGSVPNYAWGYGKIDVKAAVDAVGDGGGESCGTTAGDANQDAAVNVLDLVVTVNDILAITPLGAAGRACADMNADETINVLDLVAIVNRILNPTPGAPLAAGVGAAEAPVDWSQVVDETGLSFTFDGARVGGVELGFLLPRGYVAGETAMLEGADAGSVALRTRGTVGTVVAYAARGGSLGDGPVTLRIPLERSWDGGQTAQSLEVTRLVLADPRGAALRLSERPTPDGESIGRGLGVAAWLEAAAPNPAAGHSAIRYRVEADGPVALTVYDASGRQVRSLWNGWQMGGAHTLLWDGRDDASHPVAAGIYFVRIIAGGTTDTQKLTIVR